MNLFNNKYRIESPRFSEWDYSSNGIYFITICTNRKEHFFGKIQNEKMEFSSIGLITKQFLIDVPKHFEYVKLNASVVMPNHVHVLLTINTPKNEIFKNNHKCIQDEDIFIDVRKTLQCNFSTDNIDQRMSKISPKKGSIPTIIRSYKSAVTREARKIDLDFAWQERFHDHIVRDKTTYHKIKRYILDNPKNWESDKFY
ncbi:transposase [Flavobacterium suzhouense]|uniref:Transposase n=1 Tax=Flavobacterium suzhouense TaxID=1529638 RepID=A0ABW5NWM6_9FLAO